MRINKTQSENKKIAFLLAPVFTHPTRNLIHFFEKLLRSFCNEGFGTGQSLPLYLKSIAVRTDHKQVKKIETSVFCNTDHYC